MITQSPVPKQVNTVAISRYVSKLFTYVGWYLLSTELMCTYYLRTKNIFICVREGNPLQRNQCTRYNQQSSQTSTKLQWIILFRWAQKSRGDSAATFWSSAVTTRLSSTLTLTLTCCCRRLCSRAPERPVSAAQLLEDCLFTRR